MHQLLSNICEHEVIGEVTQLAGTLFDVARGRLCLPMLSRSAVEQLVLRLREALGELEIDDQLHLAHPMQWERGIFRINLREPELMTPYELEVTQRRGGCLLRTALHARSGVTRRSAAGDKPLFAADSRGQARGGVADPVSALTASSSPTTTDSTGCSAAPSWATTAGRMTRQRRTDWQSLAC